MEILIIDDEEMIRSKIERIVKNTVRQDEDKVVSFGDAMSAITYIKKRQPDLIFSDIRMPQMSGIDLARFIYERYPDTDVILITGYSDFEYAQAGIRYQVFDYLLKPIDDEQMVKCLHKVKDKQKERKHQREMVNIYEKHFAENRNQVRRQFFEELLFRPLRHSKIQIEQYKKCLNLEFERYCLVILECKTSDSTSPEEEYYGTYMVNKLLKEKEVDAFTYFYGNMVYWICPVSDWEESFSALLDSKITELSAYMKDNYYIEMRAGISLVSDDFMQLKTLLHQAMVCLEQQEALRISSILFFGDLEPMSRANANIYENLSSLCTHICAGNINSALTQLQIISDCLKETTNAAIWRLVLSNVTFSIEEASISEEDRIKLTDELTAITLSEIDTTFVQLITDICNSVNINIRAANSDIKKRILCFITERYAEQVGLEEAAREVNRNPSYISRLVKQSTGKSFTQLLTEKRLEEAKSLLKDSDYRVNEIAELSGYPNVRYFNRIFSANVGMTPSEYRKVIHSLG